MNAKKSTKIVQHKNSELERELVGELVLPKKDLTLAKWAAEYMDSQVVGVQSLNTVKAKKSDLSAFLTWFFEQNGHLAIEDWLPRDTQGFLDSLEKQGGSPATINRIFATLRRFARWVHERPETPFIAGLPTAGIKELDLPDKDAQKLDTREMNRLFKSADRFVLTDERKNARPRRNRAILALLYYTGLRVSELCALKREQYNGRNLVNVKRKGRARTPELYVSTDGRKYLDDYLETERRTDDPENEIAWLFISPNSTKPVHRSTVWRALVRLAEQATAHSKDDLKIYPHRLRHTFGFEMRQRTGSDTETAELLGHRGLKYVGRYVRRSKREREEMLDDL